MSEGLESISQQSAGTFIDHYMRALSPDWEPPVIELTEGKFSDPRREKGVWNSLVSRAHSTELVPVDHKKCPSAPLRLEASKGKFLELIGFLPNGEELPLAKVVAIGKNQYKVRFNRDGKYVVAKPHDTREKHLFSELADQILDKYRVEPDYSAQEVENYFQDSWKDTWWDSNKRRLK